MSRREKLYNAHGNKVANFGSARDGNLLVAFVITGMNYITCISFAYHLFEIIPPVNPLAMTGDEYVYV